VVAAATNVGFFFPWFVSLVFAFTGHLFLDEARPK
jgi:hypothetical protein